MIYTCYFSDGHSLYIREFTTFSWQYAERIMQQIASAHSWTPIMYERSKEN